MDRSTRPPSSGNAGIRLKTPMTEVDGPKPREERSDRPELSEPALRRFDVGERDPGVAATARKRKAKAEQDARDRPWRLR